MCWYMVHVNAMRGARGADDHWRGAIGVEFVYFYHA